ncbi:MAG: pyridoxal phosphate-dependent aminotransferase family protein [Deltaproteobacteria bacterium]|nr:pyridoxal phosphate-dependent aminotransferase family protein [Deltaproteobacteria bacterium]
MFAEKLAGRIDGFTLAEEGRRMGLYFYFREIVSEPGTEVVLKGGRRALMLGSNGYMGLTGHPEVKEAAVKALNKYGTGCSGSRFLNGTLDIHIELEETLSDWLGKESSILFSTGFQVNQGVLATLLNRHDVVLMDACDHASIFEGARLSMAKPERFPHNDMEKLETILSEIPREKVKFIVVDGVFSMEGDVCRLPGLAALAERYGAALMVDDAHGLGILGRQGAGTADHFSLTDSVDLIMGTFSKSLASLGGFVAGDRQTVEYLKHHARAFIFSASMPASSSAAALAALKIIRREPERMGALWRNTGMMKEGLNGLGFDTGLSETPIIPVYIDDAYTLMMMCKRLEEEGIFVNPVLPPAVPPKNSLLRVSLMATHTTQQIDFALDVFERVGKELHLI